MTNLAMHDIWNFLFSLNIIHIQNTDVLGSTTKRNLWYCVAHTENTCVLLNVSNAMIFVCN